MMFGIRMEMFGTVIVVILTLKIRTTTDVNRRKLDFPPYIIISPNVYVIIDSDRNTHTHTLTNKRTNCNKAAIIATIASI